jgi:hypothetical protein
MKIIDCYPTIKIEFFEYMLYNYGVTEEIFYNAPRTEQYRAIARYLGYPIVFHELYSDNNIEVLIKGYLDDFLESKNSDPGFFEKLKSMTFPKLIETFPIISTPEDILPSINSCIIDYSGPIFHPSLKDSIVPLKEEIINTPILDFWEEATKINSNEKAPF